MPYFLVLSVRIFSEYRIQLETLKTISEYLVMVHSTLNPVLYGLFTLRQRHLFGLIACLTCSKTQRSHKAKHGVAGCGNRKERHGFIGRLQAKFCTPMKRHYSGETVRSRARSRRCFGGVSGTSNHFFTSGKDNQQIKPPANSVAVSGGITVTTEAAVNLLPVSPTASSAASQGLVKYTEQTCTGSGRIVSDQATSIQEFKGNNCGVNLDLN